MDEAQHVRMRNAHHAHVRAASHAALLHNVRHLVDDVHERHWTRRHTSRRAHHCAVWAKEFIRHAGSAAGLVDGGGSLRVLHDSRERIRHMQNETRGELTVRFTRVYPTRRTISDHSSSGRPFKSFSEYRLLTTFLALIPSCSDFRRGETAGEPTLLFPDVLPIAALIISAFQKELYPGVLLRKALV